MSPHSMAGDAGSGAMRSLRFNVAICLKRFMQCDCNPMARVVACRGEGMSKWHARGPTPLSSRVFVSVGGALSTRIQAE
jgi:hypothetical protein